MNEQKWFDQLNIKAEANYRKRQEKVRRKCRQRNKLVALDMTLAGVLGVAVGVLYCCIF